MANLNTDLISPTQAMEEAIILHKSRDAVANIEGMASKGTEIDSNLISEDVELISNINRGFITILTGAYTESTNWRSTDFIDVVAGETLTISGKIVGTASTVVLGYNQDETVFTDITAGVGTLVDYDVVIPAGVVKIKVTTVYNNKFSVIRNTKIAKVTRQAKNTWSAIGDSISFRNGYQPLVNKYLNFKNVDNQGYSGKPLANFGGQGSIVASTVGMMEADVYTIMAGTNDFKLNVPIGGTTDYINNTGDTTFYGAFRVLIDRCYTLNINCEIVLFNILRRNNDGYTSTSTNSAGHTISDYNDAIKWVADHEALKHLDLFNESGITDRNLSETTEDGLHPNTYGYSVIAKPMIQKLNFLSFDS